MSKYEESVDLHSIGKAIMQASRFEEMYYDMERDRDYWKEKYMELLNQSTEHGAAMVGGLLSIAMKMGERA